jgi:hypothetical protein
MAMIESAAIFLLVFLAVTLETVLGGAGLAVPITGCAMLYLAIILGWRATLPVAMAAGLWLDLLFGRAWLASSLSMGIISFACLLWPPGERARTLAEFLLPGGAVGLVAILVPAGAHLLNAGFPGFGDLLHLAGQALAGGVIGALLLPAMVLALDSAATAFGLPTCRPVSEVGRRRSLAADARTPERGKR